MAKKKWIAGAIKNPGALRRTAKAKGMIKGEEKLSAEDLAGLMRAGGKTAKRARLAKTLKAMHR